MTDELFSSSLAAQVLSELVVGKTTEQWALWLQNNRNQSRRVPYRIPFSRMAGGVFYNPEELTKFAEWEKSRQLGRIKLTGRAAEVLQAYGINTTAGSTTGRKLKVSGINPQIDQATGTPYVQLIADDPLMVYRLELAEAAFIAKRLVTTIDECSRSIK